MTDVQKVRRYVATPQDLQHLREWLTKMPHIPQDFDDDFLSFFIRGCKESLQRTKLVLENFCALGVKYPHLYANLDPMRKEYVNHFKTMKFGMIPQHTKEDATLIVYNLLKEADPYLYSIKELFRNLMNGIFIMIWDQMSTQGDYVLVMDGRWLTLAHVREVTPTILSEWWDSYLTAFPLHLKGLHAVFVPAAAVWLVNLLKRLASEKIAQRIHVHENVESLHKHVPKELLPKDLGGEGESNDVWHDIWMKKLEKHRDKLVEMESKIRSLDYCRPVKKGDKEMTGTFRQLNVD